MPDLSWRDAIFEILTGANGEAMHYADIAEAIVQKNLRTYVGATPANTVAATISQSLKEEGDDSPFIKVARGQYGLRQAPAPAPAPAQPEVAEVVVDQKDDTGLINAFGMYWSRNKVLWRATPRLLGRQQAASTPVDFSGEKGVYLLHDGSKVVYVGRTTDQPLGIRLRQHTADRLEGRWDRFSWFGIYGALENGALSDQISQTYGVNDMIVTMEALLIEGLEPPQNRKRGDDFRAVEFLQEEDPEIKNGRIIDLMDELKGQLKRG